MDIFVRDLCQTFDGQKVFQQLNYTFTEGVFYMLRGDSGSGKSTLLKMIVKLMDPESGSIHSNDDLEVTLWRRKVQYLPQLAVIFPGTVKENLLIPFSFSPFINDKPSDDKLLSVLKELFPEGMNMDKKAEALSQGQKQRLAMGRVLLLNPDVLLCDEPTASLDNNSRKLVDEKIGSFFRQDAHRTVIYISHHENQLTGVNECKNLFLSKGTMIEQNK
jgi:putative ABC transport system ATP-binding protein